MSEYTKYYNLKKPAQSENYDVDVANTNNDIIDAALNNKADKQAGKGFSTNDFTDGYKSKLDNLENYDDTLLKSQLETLKQKEKEDVSEIKQEQTTQNSNISSNTTEIEKLKEENELLRSQIPTRKSKWE